MWTPWGESQTVTIIAEGITEVSTASHGGIMLSQERTDELKKAIPGVKSFMSERAFEEDCDAAIPILAWPDLWTAENVHAALESAQQWHKEIDFPAYFKTRKGKMALKMSEAFLAVTEGEEEIRTPETDISAGQIICL